MEGWCGYVFLMVRPTTLDDLPEFIPLYYRFFEEGELSGKPDPHTFVGGVKRLIDTGIVLSLVDDEGRVKGAIGGAIYDDYISGDVSCTEAFWFVGKEYRGTGGLRLLKEFEKEANARGASRIWMVHLLSLNSEKMERYYLRSGYELKEKFYLKELKKS